MSDQQLTLWCAARALAAFELLKADVPHVDSVYHRLEKAAIEYAHSVTPTITASVVWLDYRAEFAKMLGCPPHWFAIRSAVEAVIGSRDTIQAGANVALEQRRAAEANANAACGALAAAQAAYAAQSAKERGDAHAGNYAMLNELRAALGMTPITGKSWPGCIDEVQKIRERANMCVATPELQAARADLHAANSKLGDAMNRATLAERQCDGAIKRARAAEERADAAEARAAQLTAQLKNIRNGCANMAEAASQTIAGGK